jgi:hypothetical protein
MRRRSPSVGFVAIFMRFRCLRGALALGIATACRAREEKL